MDLICLEVSIAKAMTKLFKIPRSFYNNNKKLLGDTTWASRKKMHLSFKELAFTLGSEKSTKEPANCSREYLKLEKGNSFKRNNKIIRKAKMMNNILWIIHSLLMMKMI